MEIIKSILHVDESLLSLINLFGPSAYVILFLIIFAETGLVITPFLPGDSLIFAVGTLAGGGYIDILIIYFTMLIAAILGDTVNYWVGHHFGSRAFARKNSRIFKREYLEKTSDFYKKHGGKTIILARFVPIVRTFAPFVAGVGKMHYSTFLLYNITGGLIWVTSLIFAGYFLGQIPFVKANFEFVIIGIVVVSLFPMLIEFAKHKYASGKTKNTEANTSYQDLQKTFKKEGLND